MTRGLRTLRAGLLGRPSYVGAHKHRRLSTLCLSILLSSLCLSVWHVGSVRSATLDSPELSRPFHDFGDDVIAQSGITVTELDVRDSAPVTSLAELPNAVVRIEAFGTFVDPNDGLLANVAGRGSGFIIDPSGIAVTNNHVVTGAAFLQVTLPGQDEPVNARILGVSECADLAVIDIEGDGYSYVTWSEEPPSSGSELYAAGFPLGGEDFTTVEGQISVVGSSVQSNWASVDGVIQHNAAINPGFSGGPIVDENGQVLGVTYAGNPGSVQFFAIAQAAALPVVAELASGTDIDAVGINGQVVNFVDDSYGVWVASVASGSAADNLGLRGGDILVSLEGFSLTGDRTMGSYCNILRSHNRDDILNVQVIRFATEELLEGQLNGRPLVSRFSFADELDRSFLATNDDNSTPVTEENVAEENVAEETIAEESVAEESAPEPSLTEESSASDALYTDNQLPGAGQSSLTTQDDPDADVYSGFRLVTDDSGTITIELPNEWSDISNGDWIEDGENIGVYISGAPDLDAHFGAWYNTWDTPGVFFGFSQKLAESSSADVWLDSIDLSSDCSYEGRSQLPQGYFTGFYDVWGSCGNTESIVLVVGAMPPDSEYLFVIETLSVTRADLLVVDHILDTFVINLPELSSDQELADIVKSQVDTNEMSYEYDLAIDNAINALLPVEWTNILTDSWVIDDEVVGPSLIVSTDAEGFQSNWDIPGVWARTSTELPEDIDVDVVLDSLQFRESCIYDSRYDHQHTMFGLLYESKYDLWTDCGESSSILAVVASRAAEAGQFALIEFQAITDADAEAFGVFLNSFYISDDNATATDAATDAAIEDTGDGSTVVAEVEVEVEAEEEAEADSEPVVDLPEDEAIVELAADESDVDSASDESDADSASDESLLDDSVEAAPVDTPDDETSSEDMASAEDTSFEFVEITDETQTLSVLVPDTWADIASSDWIVDGENYGLSLSASTDLVAYDEGWSTPGVFMGVSDELAALDTTAFLEFFNFNEECTYGERFLYDNQAFEGAYDVWENCGDVPGVYAVLAVKPAGETEPLIMLNVLSTERAESELFEQILGTFNYVDSEEMASDIDGEGDEPDEDAAAESNASDEDATISDGDATLEVVEVEAAETIISRVVVNALNVRSGPGVNNPRVDSVFNGELLSTIGQVNNCLWLRVVTPSGEVGWVSGSAEYVSIGGSCADLDVINPQDLQISTPPTDDSGGTSASQGAESATDAAPTVGVDNSLLGCFLFQNELNAEVTVTITRQDAEWNDTFLMQPDQEIEFCFDPGSYTYSLDAPPPWGSTNGELEVNEGDRYYFPIRSE